MQIQTMKRARVNGVELEYQVTGQGQPALLISPVVADGFLPLLEEPVLANSYRLITYHRRGWAGSTHGDSPATVADHADDAAALVAHLGLQCAHIVGHSSGAAVALQLALTHPEAVHSLGLLEASFFSVPGAAAFMKEVGPAFDAYGAGRHDRALQSFMTTVSGLEWEACRTLLERHVPGALNGALADADTFFAIELPALGAWRFGAPEARGISQPVLSMWGTQTGPLWREIAMLLRGWLPQTEECWVEGAGHLLQMHTPVPVAQGLAEFFDRHPIGAGHSRRR